MIDAQTSDLWFNHDHSEYAPRPKVRDGFNMTEMLKEAEHFSHTINGINGTEYTANDLVTDFFQRL